MASRRRSIEPEIYAHPYLLRLPLATRYLYHYLIEVACDDEGRFRADPLMIVRECFSPIDGISVDDTQEMLTQLSVPEGLVRLYGEGADQCGFLLGWYEHQKIEKRYRLESSLPPPPLSVRCWDQVDEIRGEYAEAKDLKDPDKAQAREALRWKEQQELVNGSGSLEIHARITRESRENHPSDRIGREGKGQDRKGGEGVPPAPEVENGQRERVTFQGSDAHLYGPESGVWQLFVNELSPSIPESGNGFCNLREWGLRLARADADEAYPLHGEDLREALRKNRPSSSTSPRDHVAFLEKQHHAQKNAAERDPEDPVAASARIYRETPWAFRTPEALQVQCGQWEQLLFDTFGKPENAEVERQYHAAWREYQATGDAEAFPLPPEGLGVPA